MIKGTYIFYEDGKEIYRSPNVITKFGKRYLTNFVAGNIANLGKDLAFGVDPTTATENDTRLGFEFYRLPIEFGSTDIRTVDDTTTYSVVYKTTLPQDVAGVISEVGLYPAVRTTTNNYDSKFLADFDNVIDWTDSVGNTATLTTSNAKIGDSLATMAADVYTYNTTLDISGYSANDTATIAFYKNDAYVSAITLYFETSTGNGYTLDFTVPSGTGYKLASASIGDLVAYGTPDKSTISKLKIEIEESGGTTSVGFDGIRINDEDTFDPAFGIISRSVLSTVLTKQAGRQVDVEYRLELGF
jgi:hypothetical protein